ncbi:hypothetical protein QBC45DRAFT_455272 [Copromyces sp. CBS 386.78]|nr:hypothetical protein QBC45DRAFT_455272 [Copromyces sp. CBS 386.78]
MPPKAATPKGTAKTKKGTATKVQPKTKKKTTKAKPKPKRASPPAPKPKPKPTSPKPLAPHTLHPSETTPTGDPLWELDEVVASRVMHGGKLYYQVSWKGWSKDEYWYPAGDLKRAPHLLIQFHWENPEAVGPSRRMEVWESAYWEEETEEGLEKHWEDDLPMGEAEKEGWMERVGREFVEGEEGEEEEEEEGDEGEEEEEDEGGE